MAKRNWIRVRATSLRHTMELCVEYTREKKNLSINNIAALTATLSDIASHRANVSRSLSPELALFEESDE